jgi:pimeloyl-ACP methyl ester carboxylesterase
MFERFIEHAPAALPLRVQPLPSDRPRGYADLVDALLPLLPAEPFALIAESFSGPLAILLANRCPQTCAVVLCATFIQPPLPQLLAHLPAFFWERPPSQFLLQLAMTGGDSRLARATRDAVAPLRNSILGSRVAAALTVDVTQDLQRLTQPLLFLRARRDRLLPARCADIVHTTKPSAQISDIDGPHLILQAKPLESWRLIAPFLEQAFLRAAG